MALVFSSTSSSMAVIDELIIDCCLTQA